MKYLIFGFIIIVTYAVIANLYIKLQQGKNDE
jgi:hypothetical protein